MVLQLEYSCTEAEIKEAQSLQLRQQFGGGPKWRANIIMWLVIGSMAVVVFLRFKTEIAPKDRWWFVTLVVVVFALFKMFQGKTRRKTGQVVRLEVSERELVFIGSGRTAISWSAFSQCLESPNLFVLLNRSKSVIYTVPRRAFPDERSQEWFRAQANQPRSESSATMNEEVIPGRFVTASGIGLTLQLKFSDYLIRNFTSWRFKGAFLGILLLSTFICFFSTPPPDAVNSNLKAYLFMTLMLAVVWPLVTLAVSFFAWCKEKKHLTPEHVVLSSEGIEFTGRDATGRLPWDTYKYYREGRWTFFVWQPRGSLRLMLPKRLFASPSDLDQCRSLLQTNLKASRWFYL